MKYVDFIEYVKQELEHKYGSEYRFKEAKVLKNNGEVRQGITVVSSETNMHPCIYLEEYYAAYLNGVEFEHLIDSIEQRVKDNIVRQNVNIDFFTEWEIIKNHVYYRLINTQSNMELLEKVPHRELLDLSVVYHVAFEEIPLFENQDMATVLILNEHLKMWNIEEDSLYVMAMKNMKEKNTATFDTMKNILAEFMPEILCANEAEEMQMYILKNKCGVYGAAEILVNETLDWIATFLDDDFILLPSSTHETIIIPCKAQSDIEGMREIVCEVNNTQVSAEEILSYHVYRYYRKDSCLRIVA